MLEVSRRGGFSDRNGIKPINTDIQTTSLDEHSRVSLWNKMLRLYRAIFHDLPTYSDEIQDFFRYILAEVYNQTVDSRAEYNEGVIEALKETVLKDDYDSVLTIIEAFSQYMHNHLLSGTNHDSYLYKNHEVDTIFQVFNTIFEAEYVGYRFIGNQIAPISNQHEVNAISEALGCRFKPVYMHIEKANAFLADRKKPDYANCVKESISAVEAMCEIILGVTGKEATLGNMLKHLDTKGVAIHNALKSAFNSLYGYTSDANGIRHAGDIGGAETTFEEAKFMLVSCSAFINYLTGLSAKM